MKGSDAQTGKEMIEIVEDNGCYKQIRKVKKRNVKSKSESAQDVVHEYNIVKEMLVNNSLPISVDGRLVNHNQSVFSRKLIIDKKILLNLLIDL